MSAIDISPTARTPHEAPRDQDARRMRQVLVAWDLGFLLLLPVCAVEAAHGGRLAAIAPLLVVVALAQVWLTWRTLGPAPAVDAVTAGAALGVTALACAGAMALQPDAAVLLLVVIPQAFALTPRFWLGVLVSAALVGVAAVSRVPHGRGATVSGGVQTVLIVVFVIMVGAFTLSLLRVARRRGELIEQLHATRAELAAAHHEMGVRAEHARLARDIHDTLAQGYTSLLLLMEAIEGSLGRDEDAVRERLHLGQEIARDNLAEARKLIASGDPDQLTSSPLETAIERLTSRLERELRITVRFEVLGTIRKLDSNTYVVIVRAAQEALTNVRKHASARRVDVRLEYHPHRVRLSVVDDGLGFEPSDSIGFGLTGMRARAQQIGARVDVLSRHGEGTTIVVEAP